MNHSARRTAPPAACARATAMTEMPERGGPAQQAEERDWQSPGPAVRENGFPPPGMRPAAIAKIYGPVGGEIGFFVMH